MAKIKTVEAPAEKKKKDLMVILTGIWMVAITAILPIYFQDAYSDILDAKYGFMLVADCILIGAFILYSLIAGKPKKYLARMKSYADPETGKWFTNWFKATFNWLDIFMLAFLVIVAISILLASPYVYQAFFGNETRWVGGITLLLMSITFFIASRYFKFSNGYITAFLLGTLFMTIWSITDYFDYDLMGFKYYMTGGDYYIFTSSIGNIDTYCGAAAIPMAFAGGMLVFNKEKIYKSVFYWICFTSAILSMITSSADNAYLAIAAFFAIVPIAAFKTRSGIRRYLITLATFLTAIQVVCYWNVEYGDFVLIPSGMFTTLAAIMQLKYVAAALWVLVIFLYIYDLAIKKVSSDALAPAWIRKIWGGLLIAGVIALIAAYWIANADPDNLPAILEPLREYLVFSDSWGSGRGCVYRVVMELFGDLPFIHKLIGTGPGTTAIYMYNAAYYDIALATGFIYDDPHNEWLVMLFSIGILGFIAYLGVFITPLVTAIKRSAKKYYPVVMAAGMVGVCHLAECFVNITTPMDLPTIFALFALAQSLFRSEE